MSRLTKCNKNRIECNIGHCPEDCNTCGMFNDIRKKLSHYEDLEEQGYKMIDIESVVEQLKNEKEIVKSLITPRGGKAFYEGTIRGLNKAIKIVKGGAK